MRGDAAPICDEYMAATEPVMARKPRQVRSRPRLPFSVDGRCQAARRLNALIAAIERDFEVMSDVERQIARQAASLMLHAEQLNVSAVRGEAINGDEMVKASGEARRLLSSLHKRESSGSRLASAFAGTAA